jgi:hypothetical protein
MKLSLALLEICGISTGSKDGSVVSLEAVEGTRVRDLFRSLSTLLEQLPFQSNTHGGSATGDSRSGSGAMNAFMKKAVTCNVEAFDILFSRGFPADPLAALEEVASRLNTLSSSFTSRRWFRIALESVARLRTTLEVLALLGVYEVPPEQQLIELMHLKLPSLLPRPRRTPPTPVCLDLGLVDRHGTYASGLIFHVIVVATEERRRAPPHSSSNLHHQTKGETKLVEGGQFDDLIQVFRPPPVRRSDPCFGVGLRIPIDRLVRSYVVKKPVAAQRGPTSSEAGGRGRGFPAHSLSVMVVDLSEDPAHVEGAPPSSLGGGAAATSYAERLFVAQVLWSEGIPCDHVLPVSTRFSTSPSTLEQIAAECRETLHCSHLVVVKSHSLNRDGTVRLLNLQQHHQNLKSVHVNELAKRIISNSALLSSSSPEQQPVSLESMTSPVRE